MRPHKPLVLDASILLRAVFGVRVRDLLESYEGLATFYSPDLCFEDARKYIPAIASRRRFNPAIGFEMLDQIAHIVQAVDRSLYEEIEEPALVRISSRDPDDWAGVATPLLLKATIWTEEQDFFGTGIATWTSNRIEIYLRDS